MAAIWVRSRARSDSRSRIRRAAAAGVRVAIYSSGSVRAQRLLFSCSEAGDLGPFIGDYFDTTTGPKKDPLSYRAIAEALGLPPEAILFASDNLDELRAAREAGMATRLAVRPGNA